jgi:hypothetical protein
MIMRAGGSSIAIGLLAVLAITSASTACAQRAVRSTARSSVTSSHVENVNRAQVNRTDINRNVNVNQNVNVNRNVNVNVSGGYGGCCYHDYHPVATAAAVTATAAVTAAVIGSIVNTLPPSCTAVVINGFTYQQCGSTWYQPQISGSSTTYVVVNPPG